MIKIIIPNNNLNERQYIIDIIFDEFLGLEYKFEVGSKNLQAYNIELENGKRLIIEDHFFNNFPEGLEYLKESNVPKKIEYIKNEFTPEEDIPVIYGTNTLITTYQPSKTIQSGIDIFASSFFMLARWEEFVNKNRDKHNRFSVTESLAFKNNFLDRPIVNEYIEMLWSMLVYLGINQKRKKRQFNFVLTHDVDNPLRYTNLKSTIREIMADIIKRKDIKSAIRKTKVLLKIEKDPFDTFDYLMDISEKIGTKSYFFFMGEGVTQYDNRYKCGDPFVQKLIQKIKKRKHHIGIHPTYDAYNNLLQFKKEKKELEKELNSSILFGREHYLRFEVPTTWQIWEDSGMEWDSTLSYASQEGFRCGVCYEYSVFNILTRKKLKLKEKPLIVMDGSIVMYQPNMSIVEIETKINNLIYKTKKYNGQFVFLWHNSNFNTPEWKKYQNIYEKVLI